MELNKRLIDGVLGFCVGDCLGVPFEFKTRTEMSCHPATDMCSGGVHKQPLGTWSDDTSLLLATIDSLRDTDQIDYCDMMSRFKDFLVYGRYTVDGIVFDIGNTTYAAIKRFKGGDPFVGSINFRESGNGSLMRILPLAYTDCGMDQIFNVSSLTHAQEVCKVACGIYVAVARGLLNGQSIDEAVTKACMRFCTIDTFLITFRYFNRLCHLRELHTSDINNTGYVVDTLEAALWCVTTTDNYKDCVLKAVNLGGDTDTIAALGGGLAGILYGIDSIPTEWIEKVRNVDRIYKICGVKRGSK